MYMKLSNAYFKKLLYETQISTAIYTLSNFWSYRLDESKNFFGLSIFEYNVQLILIYTGEVMNGGHEQYYLNRGLKYFDDTLNACQEISLELQNILLSSKEYVENNSDKSYSNLDNKLYEIDVDSKMLDYLKKHESNVLLQERGLIV